MGVFWVCVGVVGVVVVVRVLLGGGSIDMLSTVKAGGSSWMVMCRARASASASSSAGASAGAGTGTKARARARARERVGGR